MKTIIIALFMSIFFTGNVMAADEAANATTEETFTMLDSDKDGFVTMEEAKHLRGLPERFSAADSNGDGKLILTEFADTVSN